MIDYPVFLQQAELPYHRKQYMDHLQKEQKEQKLSLPPPVYEETVDKATDYNTVI